MNIQKNGMNLLLVAEAAVLIIVLVLGLVGGATGALKNNNDNPIISDSGNNEWYVPGTNNPSNGGSENKDPGDTEPEDGRWYVPEEYVEGRVTFSDSVEAKLSSMTLQQKVAQLFLISPEALTENSYNTVTVFGNASKQYFDKYPVGGLVYSPINFQNAAQTQALLKGIKDYSIERYGMPIFTAIEEEGGANNSPLANALEINRVSSASELGNQGLTAVEQAATARVNYVKANQFNLLLSTVADVSPALDTAYRLRTYGTDANVVAAMVAADIKAAKDAGMMGTLKYFPGKANASDGGAGILSSTETIEDLSKGSFISYQEGIDAGATFVMIGNVIVESITDDENVPCCLSSRTVGLLRESMGFDGVIITESFSDEAFASIYGAEAACIEAIKAGVDMIYMPMDFVKAYNAVLDAVNSGNISEDRLNNAVGRILTAKGM
ncbi:MAG: glycoside hydrolase family 3 N-terminal domain-containing protein [Agathobacter sp.]